MKQHDDAWEEMWNEPPKSLVERLSPLVALGIACLLAWVS